MPTPDTVIHLLEEMNQTVATCESLTGGLICAALTSVPGSSEVVRGGLITYATDLKTHLAGVDASLIRTHGVVSSEVAQAMAEGVRRVCGADWGIGVTGVAGPGPSDGVDAGTVWLAVVGPTYRSVIELRLEGDRTHVRTNTVTSAVAVLYHLLTASENPSQTGFGTVN